MPTLNRITVIILVLLSTACARTYQARYVDTSNFLDDYSLLTEGEDGDALLSYWKKDTNWPAYKKIIVEPVAIRKIPDSDLNEMPQTESQRLKDLFEFRLRDALKKDFKLVNKPGPDTLRIQYAITDAETSTLFLDQLTTFYPSARAVSLLKRVAIGTESYVGQASIEGKITDSQTGELLMASADCRAGGKTLVGSLDTWDDVEQAYQYWAAQTAYLLCTKQGHSQCQEPD